MGASKRKKCTEILEICKVREVRGLEKYTGNRINGKRSGQGRLELSFT